MLLTGTFQRALDEKGRIAVPKPIRETLGESGKSLFLTPNTDGSLALYTADTLSRLAERLAAASPNGHDVRAFSRLFYARTQPVEMDSQGRIRIPPELSQLAGLSAEVMLLGVQDHLELWDKSRWETYVAQLQSQFDAIAEAAFVPQPK